MVDFSQHISSAAIPAGLRLTDAMTKVQHVEEAFVRMAETYRFQSFAVMRVPSKGSRHLADLMIMTNWPREFLQDYDAANMLAVSPAADRLRRSTVPFTYDTRLDPRRFSGHRGYDTLALLERIKVPRGIFIPVHDNQANRGAVTFGGEREPVDSDELKELTFISASLFSRLSEIKEHEKRRSGLLSRREVECLHWASIGKTTAEIAQILALSDYTVNHYLSRATRKLDSVNRVQTVAKAIRAGLIG